jgi:leucyl aminopeptidase
MKIAFAKPGIPAAGIYVVGVLEDRALTPSAKALDARLKGALSRAVKGGRFKGKKESGLTLVAPAGVGVAAVYAVGLGKASELDALRLQATGGHLYAALANMGQATATVAVDELPGAKLKPAEMAAEIALGARLRSYRFDKYRTKEEKDDKPALETLALACADTARAKALYATKDGLADSVFFVRDLVSEPANVVYPESLARAAATLRRLGVRVEVLGEAQMRRLGMNALLAVGQGSARDSQLVIMEWNGLGAKGKGKGRGPLALVGKGVTFDTGGISIKPSANMEDMKWDMAGAGAVIGAMRALAARKAKAHVVGVVGLVENMPSGTAQRPGDVVRSMSGQTIEVINTDAEGRLVLADALWYCQKRFKPRAVVDLATLTGAIIICLGHEKAGLFSNDDKLAEGIAAAGAAVAEPVWRMPLGEEYDRIIKSEIADMKNVGNRGAGSITAAQFLQRFIVKGTPWAHIDIAGMAWATKDLPTVPKGGAAFGVRLLDRLVADRFEGK